MPDLTNEELRALDAEIAKLMGWTRICWMPNAREYAGYAPIHPPNSAAQFIPRYSSDPIAALEAEGKVPEELRGVYVINIRRLIRGSDEPGPSTGPRWFEESWNLRRATVEGK